VSSRELAPPWVPDIANDADTSHFSTSSFSPALPALPALSALPALPGLALPGQHGMGRKQQKWREIAAATYQRLYGHARSAENILLAQQTAAAAAQASQGPQQPYATREGQSEHGPGHGQEHPARKYSTHRSPQRWRRRVGLDRPRLMSHSSQHSHSSHLGRADGYAQDHDGKEGTTCSAGCAVC